MSINYNIKNFTVLALVHTAVVEYVEHGNNERR